MTSPQRAEAAAALMAALREVADANERLQLAVAWVFEAFGDQLDAETVRMLPVRGAPHRPGRPPVPGTRDQGLAPVQPLYVTGDETPDETGTMRHGIGMPEWAAKFVDRVKHEPARCWCGHVLDDHSDTACHVGTCQCGGFDDEGLRR